MQKPEKSALLGFQGAVKASKQKACRKQQSKTYFLLKKTLLCPLNKKLNMKKLEFMLWPNYFTISFTILHQQTCQL